MGDIEDQKPIYRYDDLEEDNEIEHLKFLIRALNERVTELERIVYERDDE